MMNRFMFYHLKTMTHVILSVLSTAKNIYVGLRSFRHYGCLCGDIQLDTVMIIKYIQAQKQQNMLSW